MDNIARLAGKRIHFVGIGGAGMSGIARIMLSEDLTISGSDVRESAITQALATLGAKIFIGHDAKNVEGIDLLITSGAISTDNPEVAQAISNGVEIITRAQALAILMEGKRSIAVAGTHGKTTTTSMLTVALQSAGLDPSFAIGGLINSSGVNAHLGSGDIFVAEADESDGSFTAYHPLGAIITNLEQDPNVECVPQTDELYHQAFDLFRSRPDKEWGMIDCMSFVVMQQRGLNEALTADEHFQQAGFRALLRG